MGLRPHLGGNNTVQDITYASGSTRRLRTPGLRVPSFRRAPRGSRVNTTGWATVTPVCPERSFPCKPRRSVGTDTAPSTKQGQSDGRGIAGKLHRQNAGALRMNATCEFAQMRARARLDSARLVLSSRRRGTGRLQGRPGDHATGRGLANGLPRTRSPTQPHSAGPRREQLSHRECPNGDEAGATLVGVSPRTLPPMPIQRLDICGSPIASPIRPYRQRALAIIDQAALLLSRGCSHGAVLAAMATMGK